MADFTSGAVSLGSLVGDPSFDVADRLAIVNVLNSYGYFVDELRMDDFFGLFTDSPTVEVWRSDKQVVDSWARFKHLATSRQEFFARENIQRRHVLSAPRFERQSVKAASGQVYLRLYKVYKGVVSLITMGYYEFTAVKKNGHWNIDRWIGRLDLLPDSTAGEPLGN